MGLPDTTDIYDIKPLSESIPEKNFIDADGLVENVEFILDICNASNYQNLKILKKVTASKSSQVLSNIGKKSIFLKIFYEPLSPDWDNTVSVEAAVYVCIIPTLIKKCTPFLSRAYAYQECPNFMEGLKMIDQRINYFREGAHEKYQPLEIFNQTKLSVKVKGNEYEQKIRSSYTGLAILVSMMDEMFIPKYYETDYLTLRSKIQNLWMVENVKILQKMEKIKDKLLKIKEHASDNEPNTTTQRLDLETLKHRLTETCTNKSDCYNGEVRILVIEKFPDDSMSFFEWLHFGKSFYVEDYKSIFFQILWTLYCFKRIGFRHNDPHLGNIMIIDTKKTEYYKFEMGSSSKQFIVPIRYKVCIFDFDRSTMVGVTKNSALKQFCNDGLGCNEKNDGYDVFRIMDFLNSWETGLYGSDINSFKKITKDFFTRLIPTIDLNDFNLRDKLPHKEYFEPRRLDKIKSFNEDEIVLDFKIEEGLTSDPFFQDFRNSKEKYSQSFKEPTKEDHDYMEQLIKTNFPETTDYPEIINSQGKNKKKTLKFIISDY